MPPPERDAVYVGHMLDLARKAAQRAAGTTKEDYDRDEDLQMVLTHLVQTIGESARRVSPAYQSAHPEVPWHRIIGMRHKIVHDYLDVDTDIVWDVAAVELPHLVPALERLVHNS
ncbi:MAG: HepT-like ribonuclease domain-containing protein [bacterium]